MPDSVTNQSTQLTFAKCYLNAEECVTTGQFADISALSLDGVALTTGAWISFPADYDATSPMVNINPTYAHIGPHVLTVTWTPTWGAASTYSAITLTIECEITSFTAPSQADITYTIYEPQVSADISALAYVQTPACGYAYTRDYTWANVAVPVSIDTANDGKVDIASIKPSELGTHALSLSTVLTVSNGNNGGTDTFAMNAGADLVAFEVTVINPCTSTTIEDITFTMSPVMVVNGFAEVTTWTMPITALDTAKADTGLCGLVSFEVFLDLSAEGIPTP